MNITKTLVFQRPESIYCASVSWVIAVTEDTLYTSQNPLHQRAIYDTALCVVSEHINRAYT